MKVAGRKSLVKNRALKTKAYSALNKNHVVYGSFLCMYGVNKVAFQVVCGEGLRCII